MILIQRYIDLCLFKASPADMPSSAFFMRLTLCLYFVVGVLISLIDMEWMNSVLTSVADTIFMIVAVALLVKVRGLEVRFQQTLTALAGAGIFIGLLSIPILIWFYQVPEPQQAEHYSMIFLVAIMMWSLMVTSHIFRYALDVGIGMSMFITIFILFFLYSS
jgi:hypothetical protein